MLIIESVWQDRRSFKLIPTHLECPYMDAFFDVENKALIVIGKGTIKRFQMMPRLKEDGQPKTQKGFDQETGKEILSYKQERVAVEVHPEYIITNKKDIEGFIKLFAINPTNTLIKEILKDEVKKKVILTK